MKEHENNKGMSFHEDSAARILYICCQQEIEDNKMGVECGETPNPSELMCRMKEYGIIS